VESTPRGAEADAYVIFREFVTPLFRERRGYWEEPYRFPELPSSGPDLGDSADFDSLRKIRAAQTTRLV